MIYVLISLFVIGVIFFMFKYLKKSNNKLKTRKVIKLPLHRANKKSAYKQKCSICYKKSKRLIFYANEYGKAIGVCDNCKSHAERRALLKL